jgi:hypothetical protein
MQGIGGGRVKRLLVSMEDRGPVGHGVHQLGTPLDGREAVRDGGDRWNGHAVELCGVEDRILP